MAEYKAAAWLNLVGFTAIPQFSMTGDEVVEVIDFSGAAFNNATFEGCSGLQKVFADDVPAMGDLSIISCSQVEEIFVVNCASLNAAVLTTLPGLVSVNLEGNTQLSDVTATGWDAAEDVNFSGAALSEASVDAVLAACDASGVENGDIDLTGGTSAPPSSSGLSSKSSLEGKGWNVEVNEA